MLLSGTAFRHLSIVLRVTAVKVDVHAVVATTRARLNEAHG